MPWSRLWRMILPARERTAWGGFARLGVWCPVRLLTQPEQSEKRDLVLAAADGPDIASAGHGPPNSTIIQGGVGVAGQP